MISIALWGFPGDSVVKNPPVKAGDTGLVLGSGRSPVGGTDNPLQCSCLGNSMDRGVWWATQSMGSRKSGGHNLATNQQHSHFNYFTRDIG